MLTKDLLKYSKRDGRIHPKYIKPDDSDLLSLASRTINLYAGFLGKTAKDLQEEAKRQQLGLDVVSQGFLKLCEDRSQFSDCEEHIEAARWQAFQESKSIRLQAKLSYEDFQRSMAEMLHKNFAEIESSLYADLPEFKKLQAFETMEPAMLLHRYNIAQIQGLLLRAQKVRFIMQEPDLLIKRRLLQKLRFYRLLAEFKEPGQDKFEIELSGPLAIFDQSQSYGMRLCQFFPYVLLLKSWELMASVKIDNDIYELSLDGKRAIKSFYSGFKGYIPEEYQEFIAAFNALKPSDRNHWRVEEGGEPRNLGQQSYCFPDLSFYLDSGKRHDCELFHRWHGEELKRRLQSLGNQADAGLMIGVSDDLIKQENLQGKVAEALGNGVSIFTFKHVPKVKAILAYLNRVQG